MAVPSRSPGLVGETPQRTPLYAAVWFLFISGFAWYSLSSGSPPYLYRCLSKPGPTWTLVIAPVVVRFSYFTISGGRVEEATLGEWQAAAKAFEDVRKNLDLQGRDGRALKWRQ